MRALALVAALIVASCAPPAPNTADAQTPAEACAAKGGSWRRICLRGDWSCVMTYKDAGKTCTDGDQCESKQCRFVGDKVPKPGMEAKGACWRNTDPCGCHALIEDGKVESMICID